MTEGSRRLAVEIEYCARCNFLPRAAWVAQELLHTYGDFVAGLRLAPSGGGVFVVSVDGQVVFDNKSAGRFPEIRELKESLNRLLEAEEVAGLKQHPKRS